jgi:hypothetical protein
MDFGIIGTLRSYVLGDYLDFEKPNEQRKSKV